MNQKFRINGWYDRTTLISFDYVCGYCGKQVGSDKGYEYKNNIGVPLSDYGVIYLCPFCGKPTFKNENVLVPGESYGTSIDNLPETVQSIYDEARNSYKAGAFTGVILIARKILANVAIYFGAKDGENFVTYVDYLITEGYVPVKSRDWIDSIRKEGNEATHNQTSKNQEDAKRILDFVQMLLIINFKYNSDYKMKSEKTI
ncbi:MAG: DUF4145 domain-containing protein [Liquorilactobacillus hordei]|uniref:DUF4145 domain-containing protein n=1 Tax=Liquorilactobacillus hordei TaxID=468911 RepID=UPI0039EA8E84